MASLTTHKTSVLLIVITVLLSAIPDSVSCHSSRLQYKVKRPYDRPKITRRGKCLTLDESKLPPECGKYNANFKTYFPNILRHEVPKNAIIEYLNLSGLTAGECSSGVIPFLCGVLFPQCSNPNGKRPRMVLPCRSLCESMRDGCEDAFQKHWGYSWPSPFKCDLFPTGGGCFEGTSPTSTTPIPRSSSETPRISAVGMSKEENIDEDYRINGTASCRRGTLQAQAEGIDPTEMADADRNKPSACVKGHYNCRFSTVKSYLNGVLYCCFYHKQMVHNVKVVREGTVVERDGGQLLEPSCICSYASPTLKEAC